ncbi:L10-interacting MYB domain-containing protein [Bienertia sinuspersici]
MSNLNIEIKSEDEVVEIESTGGIGVWTEAIESYFIGLIEDEVKKGNRPTTTLTKPAWKFIKQKLKEKSGKDYSQDQVKNKCNQLRAKWKEYSKIKEEIGIGYNAVTHQLTAEDVVWKKLYEKHKSARTFRRKGCKHYDKLCTIFGDTTATGASSHPSTKSPSDSKDDDNTDGEVGNCEKDGEEGPKTKKAKPNVNPKKLREKVNIAMANALVAMSENSKKKLELLEKKMSATTSSTSADDGNDIGNHSKENHDLLLECIDALSSLEGIDGNSFTKATRLIHDDPLWRTIFLRLPNDRKKDLVLNI